MKNYIVLATSVMAVAIGLANVVPYPVEKSAAIGNWVGFSREATHFYRLELTESGGWIGYVFSGHDPVVYRIKAWSLDKTGHLKFELTSVSEKASQIRIESEPVTSHNYFRISVRALDDHERQGWVHQLDVYKEDVIANKTTVLKELVAMTQAKAKQK